MTESKLTTELVARSLADQMVRIVAVIDRVFRNLSDAQPGYPSSTPMASAASGPSREPDGLNSVERLAAVSDPARRDLDRLHELVGGLRLPIDELAGIVAAWSYERVTPESVDDGQTEWCTSCLRAHTFEPTYRMVGKSPLCWFCWNMLTEYGRRPSLALLDKHSRGRVTRKDRVADIAAQRATKRPRRRAA